MLNATRREITRAYRDLWQTARCLTEHRQDGRPRWLVLFYAVECGMKAAIMKERLVESVADLREDHHIGHDLRKGLELLNARETWRELLETSYQTRHKVPQAVAWKQAHEAFRYGIALDGEEQIVQGLEEILLWLKERLS